MSELTAEQFLDILKNKLSELQEGISQPNNNMENINSYRIINTPLESINKTQNALPILKTFQVSIEHWSNTQNNCMEMASRTDEKLRDYNIIRTITNPCIYDSTNQKYNLIVMYEVRWEALTNSFICIK